MKRILVVYYTQTGQLHKALTSTLAPLEKNGVKIDYLLIEPEKAYPYPWSYMEFFDIFPETVHGIPVPLKPFKIDESADYDLVVLAYQPWFLSICVPINTFMQTEEAKKLLKGKNVVTLLACRNMWLNGQEKMKLHLKNLEANLVGNITYVDKAANLVSLVTVLAFVLGGKKENFMGIFPKYGVSDKDLAELAPKLGEIMLSHLKTGDYATQQSELIAAGGIIVKPNLLLMEGRGRDLFPLYANYISKKGTSGSSDRRGRVRTFGIVLPTAILILSPIITIISRLAPVLFPKKIKKEVDYYSQNTLR